MFNRIKSKSLRHNNDLRERRFGAEFQLASVWIDQHSAVGNLGEKLDSIGPKMDKISELFVQLLKYI